jgi:hypothetical protein
VPGPHHQLPPCRHYPESGGCQLQHVDDAAYAEYLVARIAGARWGILLYLRQEGRGIGLVNKLRAYRLQDQGFDTLDANTRLGLPDEARDFPTAARMLDLLGVRAVIAESFERIHRSNLVGMGVLPLQFAEGSDRKTAGLDGSETFDITGVASLKPRQMVTVNFTRADGSTGSFETLCRIDTEQELEYFYAGGILPYVLRKLAA